MDPHNDICIFHIRYLEPRIHSLARHFYLVSSLSVTQESSEGLFRFVGLGSQAEQRSNFGLKASGLQVPPLTLAWGLVHVMAVGLGGFRNPPSWGN